MGQSAISFKEKASFGIGAIGKDMGCAIIFVYLMMYFTDVVGVSAAFVGILFLVARFWDAVNDPIMGWIVDNTKTKYGKFRPWILIGTLINCAVVLCLFYNPAQFLGPVGVMVYCAIFYILWGMTYTIMDIPYWSMIPAFSTDSKVRDVMSVIPRTCAMFGNQAVVIFGLSMIAFFGVDAGGTQSDGFFRYTLFIVVVFILAEIICVRNVREHVQTPLRQKITFKGMLNILAKNDQLVVIIVLTVIQQLAQNLVNGSILYYFKYAICNENVYPYFMGAGAITQFAAFIVFPKIVEKTSRKTVYILSALLMAVGYLGLFFFGSTVNSSIIIAGLFFCIASSGVALSIVCTTVMLADTVDYGEFKLGVRSESIVFSMQTMTVKFGSALAGFMSGMTLSLVGYVPNVAQSEGTLLGLRLVMFIASAVMVLVMLVFYLKYYKLNGDFYKNMLTALQVTRDNSTAEKSKKYPIKTYLNQNCVLLAVKCETKEELLKVMVERLQTLGAISSKETFMQDILTRESQGATGIADGIAIPHAKSEAVLKPTIIMAKLDKAIDFNAPDGKASNLVFMIASPKDSDTHLDLIGHLALILNDAKFLNEIRTSSNEDDVVDTMIKAETVLAK